MSDAATSEGAANHWAARLKAWAIPAAILAQAPESPWGFPPSLFAHFAQAAADDPEPSPSRRHALEALRVGGTVLDIGAGAGAASLPLAPPASALAAVDESKSMLAAFSAGAGRRQTAHRTIAGRWPDIAPEVPKADVVVCHHVLYNVADIVPFLAALNDHARRRVVIEITERHPQSDMTPLWGAIHHVERPTGPTASDAIAVADMLGLATQAERFRRPNLWAAVPRQDRIAFARRRLCVGADRDAEIGRLLDATGAQWRDLMTIWWDVAGDVPTMSAATRPTATTLASSDSTSAFAAAAAFGLGPVLPSGPPVNDGVDALGRDAHPIAISTYPLPKVSMNASIRHWLASLMRSTTPSP